MISGAKTGMRIAAAVLIIVAVCAVWGVCYKLKIPRMMFEPVFYNDIQKMKLVSEMRVNVNASVEAEKSAVLADTDEASRTFAAQAEKASDTVEADRQKLGTLIEAEKTGPEMDMFRQFSICWEKFQQVDKELLPLSEQNTNIKAYNLSHGAGDTALDHLDAALKQITAPLSAPGIKACDIQGAAYRIMIAALRIQVLQSPHIAESSFVRMDEIEAKIHTCDQHIRDDLKKLSDMTGASGTASIKSVEDAYTHFWQINTEILKLSRQNSNIRSMTLSLGQKRKVTAECQDVLSALEELLQNRSFKATR